MKSLLKNFPVISRTKGSFTKLLQEKICERLNVEAKIFSEISSREAFIQLINANLGIGFFLVDEFSQLNGIKFIEFLDEENVQEYLKINRFLYYPDDLENHPIIEGLKLMKKKHPPALDVEP